MIAFASLFLGLTLGLQPVEVLVSDEVAAVEMRLGGRRLGVIEGPPWAMKVDFGSELVPQLLEAVALGAERQEIGRVRQHVNLPHPPVKLSVVLEGHSQARLTWESTVGVEPRAVAAWLDGEPLKVKDPRRIPLPALDMDRTHLFNADILFGNKLSSQVTLAFGGPYLDQVSTELTGIPVFYQGDLREPPPAEALGSWFEDAAGRPLTVAAVDTGPEELIFVLTENLDPRLYRPHEPRLAVPLDKDQTVRFVLPPVRERPGVAKTFNVHPVTRGYTRRSGGLYRLLTGLTLEGDHGAPQIAGAVAVAGLTAYERHRRRAAVLVIGAAPSAGGHITPSQSRRYLEHLKVPFYVWTVARANAESVWGEAVNVSTYEQLKKAFAELSAALDRQWIVWFDGVHLPQYIRLSPAAEGITLAPPAQK